jgi:nicotinate-nucleotide adenylyltransferase
MRLGILGGTFDPIHFGHLKIAEFCRKELNLDLVLFIPSGNPPHKKAVADYKHRVRMIKLALKDCKYFKVSELEKRTADNQWTYSINTLKRVKSLYPDAEIFFFIGEDNVLEIRNWYRYKELFNYAKFVVLSRDVESKKFWKKPHNRTRIQQSKLDYFDKLQFLNMSKIDIASNMIRSNIAKNLSISGFVPKIVEDYIKENKLYLKEEK